MRRTMKNALRRAVLRSNRVKGSEWNGWGVDGGNSRFQNRPGLTAADVPRLALKWAFGFPDGNSAYGQPSVVGGRVFVGADTGFVYALDAATGCVHWSFRANAGVRTRHHDRRRHRARIGFSRQARRRQRKHLRRERRDRRRRSGAIGPTRTRSRA